MWAHSEGNTEWTLQVDEIKILIFLLAFPGSPTFKGCSRCRLEQGCPETGDAVELLMPQSWRCSGTSGTLELVMLWDLSFSGFPRWDGEQQPKLRLWHWLSVPHGDSAPHSCAVAPVCCWEGNMHLFWEIMIQEVNAIPAWSVLAKSLTGGIYV